MVGKHSSEQYGGWNRMLRGSILNCNHETEKSVMRCLPSKPTLSDILPPASLHLLKVSQCLQTTPPAGNKVCKYVSLWGTFLIQTTTHSMPVFSRANHRNLSSTVDRFSHSQRDKYKFIRVLKMVPVNFWLP